MAHTTGHWYLQHIRINKRITCESFNHALSEWYHQACDEDGSIPWIIRHDEGVLEITPKRMDKWTNMHEMPEKPQ